ncbi:MAG: ribbon-helix-helix protein, CopG family [bacterium]
MSKTITFRLSDEMEEEFNRLVEQENRSKSDVLREALEKYMTIKRFRKLREKTLPFAESQGILTDDDVFELMS